MKPIKLRIRKKTRVPTKNAIVHQWRSDWKLAGVIDYHESIRMFKFFNPNNPIGTDAQLAKLMFRNYGSGIYNILAWRKGRKGMWSFLTLELSPAGFKRLPKNVSIEEKENKKIVLEIKRLRDKYYASNDQSEKSELLKEIEDLKGDIDLNKEIMHIDKSEKRGPTPFLKQTQPVYRFHGYESPGEQFEEVKTEDEIW